MVRSPNGVVTPCQAISFKMPQSAFFEQGPYLLQILEVLLSLHIALFQTFKKKKSSSSYSVFRYESDLNDICLLKFRGHISSSPSGPIKVSLILFALRKKQMYLER